MARRAPSLILKGTTDCRWNIFWSFLCVQEDDCGIYTDYLNTNASLITFALSPTYSAQTPLPFVIGRRRDAALYVDGLTYITQEATVLVSRKPTAESNCYFYRISNNYICVPLCVRIHSRMTIFFQGSVLPRQDPPPTPLHLWPFSTAPKIPRLGWVLLLDCRAKRWPISGVLKQGVSASFPF